MTSFPGSPRLIKGAIVSINVFNPIASEIVFQYNPHTLTRSLQASTPTGEGTAPSEAMRFKGAPVETISLSVDIDAADQLEQGESNAVSMGIYPQLSALEMILYPKSALVIANTVLMATGDHRGHPACGPVHPVHMGAEAGAACSPDQF